ncbi:MAG TPA: NAD-dependent protein deacetylase [Gammaproteobacteria bacterium]|nr:NAD-dependent protein deacetylase [Gammaproteobacteria bacterium]
MLNTARRVPPAACQPAAEPAALAAWLDAQPRLFVLTGAGCSTASGIPDYRDADGVWRRGTPMAHRDFIGSAARRRRYWARSLAGWPAFAAARPNPAHGALADLERAGRIVQLVTQNVDALHQRAGSQRVIDLHGRLDRVICLDCGVRRSRHALQQALLAANPGWDAQQARILPDGDVAVEDDAGFLVPACPHCGGILKPDVVFFGERVPPARVEAAFAALSEADAVLVVGSSLMVYSGFRFVREAIRLGKPVAAINLGRTRADDLFTLRLAADAADALPPLVAPFMDAG